MNENDIAQKSYLKNLGYSDEQISIIYNFFKNNNFNFKINVLDILLYITKFINYGISKEEFLKFSVLNPNFFITDLKIVVSKFQYFEELGMTKDMIKDIIIKNPNILFINIEEIKNIVVALGNVINKRVIANFVWKNFIKFNDGSISYDDKRDFFIEEFKEEGFNKIVKVNPKVFFFSFNLIKKKYDFFISIGFTKDFLLKILLTQIEVFNISEKKIINFISFIESFGFSKNEVIIIITNVPKLLLMSHNKIKEKIEIIKSFGYNDCDIKTMIYQFPAIFTYSIEFSIKPKLKLIQELEAEDIIKKSPKKLMLGVKVLLARKTYLENNYKHMNKDDLITNMFISNRMFLTKFKVKNEYVLAWYEEYLLDVKKR